VIRNLIVVGCGVLAASPVLAQVRRAAVPPQPDPQVVARYQLVVMEGVLEAAVQHGARVLSSQLQTGMPQMTLMSGNARARGFRLDGYGVFFDVDVPAMRQSIVWSWRQLDRDNAGAVASLEALKKLAATVTDPAQKREVEQAIRSIELRVGPMPSVADRIRVDDPVPAGGQTKPAAVSTGTAAKGVPPPAPAIADPAGALSVPDDPGAAYTDAVRDALIDAMLSYSQQLAIGAEEWLTVAARDASNPRVTGEDPADVTTIFLRVKGSDLKALHEGRLTRDEARKRVEVREY
jgi:hypothetical protein